MPVVCFRVFYSFDLHSFGLESARFDVVSIFILIRAPRARCVRTAHVIVFCYVSRAFDFHFIFILHERVRGRVHRVSCEVLREKLARKKSSSAFSFSFVFCSNYEVPGGAEEQLWFSWFRFRSGHLKSELFGSSSKKKL